MYTNQNILNFYSNKTDSNLGHPPGKTRGEHTRQHTVIKTSRGAYGIVYLVGHSCNECQKNHYEAIQRSSKRHKMKQACKKFKGLCCPTPAPKSKNSQQFLLTDKNHLDVLQPTFPDLHMFWHFCQALQHQLHLFCKLLSLPYLPMPIHSQDTGLAHCKLSKSLHFSPQRWNMSSAHQRTVASWGILDNKFYF
jgi:hypothetical protein